jgi:hypothetical protein
MTTSRTRFGILPLLILAAAGTPGAAAAQRVSLAPAIGLYIPTEQFYKAATTGNSADLRKQEVSIGLGGRLGIVGSASASSSPASTRRASSSST